MTIAIEDLPKVVILEPQKGVRMEVVMSSPAVEIDLTLEKEAPGRSFVFMIAHTNGEVVQRIRIAGHAKILFDPEAPGDYVFLLTNPMTEAAIVRCSFQDAPSASGGPVSRSRPKGDSKGPRPRKPTKEYDPAFR